MSGIDCISWFRICICWISVEFINCFHDFVFTAPEIIYKCCVVPFAGLCEASFMVRVPLLECVRRATYVCSSVCGFVCRFGSLTLLKSLDGPAIPSPSKYCHPESANHLDIAR